MKTFIQITVLLLAILLGLAWEVFKPQIHGFFKLPQSLENYTTDEKRQPRSELPSVTPPAINNELKENIAAKGEMPSDKATELVMAEAVIEIPKLDANASAEEREEQIQRIVMKRYPDIPKTPFLEKFPQLDQLAPRTFPSRIITSQELNFKLAQGKKLIGMSFVKAGGFIRPRRIDGDKIIVSSLADGEMMLTLALNETDFFTTTRANYDAGLQRAITRGGQMREMDAEEIRKNPTLLQKLITEGRVWQDQESSQFDDLKATFARMPASSFFKPIAFYGNGLIQVEKEGSYSGSYYVVIVLLEANDAGFGPYHWAARCLLRNGQIIGWLGLPERLPGKNS